MGFEYLQKSILKVFKTHSSLNIYSDQVKDELKRLVDSDIESSYSMVLLWVKNDKLPITENQLILILKLVFWKERKADKIYKIFYCLLLNPKFKENDRYLDLIFHLKTGKNGKIICNFLNKNFNDLPVYTLVTSFETMISEDFICDSEYMIKKLIDDDEKRPIVLKYISHFNLSHFSLKMSELLLDDLPIDECEIVLKQILKWKFKDAYYFVHQFESTELCLYDLEEGELNRISNLISEFHMMYRN